MNYWQFSSGKTYLFRLKKGDDLLQQIERQIRQLDLQAGIIMGIGAVQRAQVGFYDQIERVYRYLKIDEPMEIVSLTGNISLKDGKPFIHTHIALAKADGTVVGGHLAAGTIVFAAEIAVLEFKGPKIPHRLYDEETGLSLWSFEK